MSGKFMKIRRILIPTITMVMIASQLFGCSCSTQDELNNMINKGDVIEIEVPEPNFEIQGTESKISWTELASNTEDESFRKAFELILGITNENGIKNGIVYVNLDGKTEQNNTLYNAFMNKSFVDNYWNNEEVQQAVAIAVGEHYADVESDSDSAKYSALYLYWGLLPDYEPNFANMGSSLSRAEAMTFLMRATTQVTDDGKPVSNAEFEALVGESDYTDYASYLDNKAFINTSDKSLNNQTFNGTMTKGEFVYLLINSTFGAEAINNVDVSSTKLNDCKDGGSSIEAQEFGNGDYATSYKLVYALENPDKGAPTPIYKALVKAKQLDIISAETSWDEALTREDAAELFVETMLAYSNLNGFKVEGEAGAVDENIAKLEAEAKEAYATVKDSISIDEEGFVRNYKDLITNKGLNKEEAIEEIKMLYDKEIEQETTETPTEKPVEKPVEKPEEKPTTGNNQQKPLDLLEAHKLTPSGSYTEEQIQLDSYVEEMFNGIKIVRRTYENGAVRDYMIIDGEEAMLDYLWGVAPEDYEADPNAGAHVMSGEKPTKPQKQEVVYKGIFPPRSNYSSDAEWESVVNDISNNYQTFNRTFFSSEADSKLYADLCYGGGYEGDTSFINMSTEEWLKWCEENGFSVN